MGDADGAVLAGYRLLDLSGAEGAVCAKLFADLGADVIKVEPVGGCPSRRLPPFRENGADLDASLWFQFYNAGKRSVTLNLDTPSGCELLLLIAEHADVLLESFPPEYLQQRGIPQSQIEAVNDRLIIASIAGFGEGGPYSGFKASESVLLAMSGIVSMSGLPKHEPCAPPHGLAYEAASLLAAMGILSALGREDLKGHLSRVVASAYECATVLTDSGISKASMGQDPRREGDAYLFITPGGLYRCQDGYVRIVAGQLRHWRALVDWMGRPDPICDSMWEDRNKRNQNRAMIDALVSSFTADKTRDSLFREGQKHRVPVTPVNTPAEFLDSDLAASRRFVQFTTDRDLGDIKALAPPFVIDGKRSKPARRAPRLGEHNCAFYVEQTGVLSREEMEQLFAAGVI